MVRRTAGFISKRPHRKSRAGCTTCKRKKVKCDESLPSCSYCALRKLECTYPPKENESSEGSLSSNSPPFQGYPTPTSEEDWARSPTSNEIQPWLVPAAHTSAGQLTPLDLDLLHQYKQTTWRSLSVRDERYIDKINQEWIPEMAISRDYLLNMILCISATHRQTLAPSPENKNIAILYRQKTFNAYNKALQVITAEKYETLLLTSLYMQVIVPPPDPPCTDTAMLEWLTTFLAIMQGLRILAGLKWASGIEKLSIFPIFRRELRKLPPPPLIWVQSDERSMFATDGPLGDTPSHPNPPATYSDGEESLRPVSAGVDMTNIPFRPQTLMSVTHHSHNHVPKSWKPHSWQIPAPAFLPPPLMALLLSLVHVADTGPIDLHRATLLPVIHALSPIFLSLYHYHLTPDVYVRILVLPTFLTPEFMSLVRNQEPRALVIMAWWFSFLSFLPNLWWVRGSIPRLLQAASNSVMRSEATADKKMMMDAIDGAFKVVRMVGKRGVEFGARLIFEGWEGVNWEEGGSVFVNDPECC